jgi:hypothetical protein
MNLSWYQWRVNEAIYMRTRTREDCYLEGIDKSDVVRRCGVSPFIGSHLCKTQYLPPAVSLSFSASMLVTG